MTVTRVPPWEPAEFGETETRFGTNVKLRIVLKPFELPSLKKTSAIVVEDACRSVIVNLASVSLATEVVVCLTPSIYRLTLEVSPAVKPEPARVTMAVFEAASNPGVNDVTVVVGA